MARKMRSCVNCIRNVATFCAIAFPLDRVNRPKWTHLARAVQRISKNPGLGVGGILLQIVIQAIIPLLKEKSTISSLYSVGVFIARIEL